jgi:hypothetical protein
MQFTFSMEIERKEVEIVSVVLIGWQTLWCHFHCPYDGHDLGGWQ